MNDKIYHISYIANVCKCYLVFENQIDVSIK